MTIDAPIMRLRCPAQSIIEVLLLEQRLVAPRRALERLVGRSPLGADSVRCLDAARAEIAVGLALAELPRDWIVFHSLPVGDSGADVDHLVIGPGGVFALHSDRQARKSVLVAGRSVLVGARKIPYIREAEFEAVSLTALLSQRMPSTASVRGVVVLVDTKRVTVQTQPSRVKIIKVTDLCTWLQGLPSVLPPPSTGWKLPDSSRTPRSGRRSQHCSRLKLCSALASSRQKWPVRDTPACDGWRLE
ncbi:nuclease-related domain-containing protein [Cryobacterium sp. Y57]|uniref:nuclease-related domain-containing protein n=1 Tax=Cryobacterium sp. Y57 TaxID=2048287 RepID=UPI0011AFE2D2|nr:nuclease-related domain-containing protein [Cryobacterium sp. Y57]